MTGVDLAEPAKRRFPDVKIVYTSGFAEASILRDRTTQDSRLLLTKPVTKTVLANTIRQVPDDEEDCQVSDEPEGSDLDGPGHARVAGVR